MDTPVRYKVVRSGARYRLEDARTGKTLRVGTKRECLVFAGKLMGRP